LRISGGNVPRRTLGEALQKSQDDTPMVSSARERAFKGFSLNLFQKVYEEEGVQPSSQYAKHTGSCLQLQCPATGGIPFSFISTLLTKKRKPDRLCILGGENTNTTKEFSLVVFFY
jgi:hypothetical protein